MKKKKHDYSTILDRLIMIWSRLRNGEVLSVKELAIEYETSERTIQRYFNDKLIHYFPIEKIGHKWKVKDGYSIDVSTTDDQNLALEILKEFSSSLGKDTKELISSSYSKMDIKVHNTLSSKMKFEDISNSLNTFLKIQEAIIIKKQIEYIFRKRRFYFEPYKIVTFEGFWYLYGKELFSKKFRLFYLKDIEDIKIKDTIFSIDEKMLKKLDLATNVWFNPNKESFEVEMICAPEISRYLKREPINKSQYIKKEYADKSMELSVLVTSSEEIIYTLKRWVPHLLVIQPESIANKMIEISEEFIKEQKKYKGH